MSMMAKQALATEQIQFTTPQSKYLSSLKQVCDIHIAIFLCSDNGTCDQDTLLTKYISQLGADDKRFLNQLVQLVSAAVQLETVQSSDP